MFGWLRARVVKWAEPHQQWQIEALLAESRSLRAQLRELNGGKPIQLSAEQRARLAAKRKGIDPELLKAIGYVPIEDEDATEQRG